MKYDGLPPLTSNATLDDVLFVNVATLYLRQPTGIQEQSAADNSGSVLIRGGKIVCSGHAACKTQAMGNHVTLVDLRGGSISPGLTSFGSPLGVSEIEAESSTNDGVVYDPLSSGTLSGDTTLIRAADGLSYGSRDIRLAYVYGGVTAAVAVPIHYGFYGGLGVAFSLGAEHKLEAGAILQEVTAVHVAVSQTFGGTPSVSTQIGALRRLLLNPPATDSGNWFGEVAAV